MSGRVSHALYAAVITCAIGLALPAVAQQSKLRLARSSGPTSLDPHFYNISPNLNLSEHIFDALIKMDADAQPKPGLARSDPHTSAVEVSA